MQFKHLIKVSMLLIGLAGVQALSFAEVIRGKTSSNVVVDVQVNSSGQLVVGPLSAEDQTNGVFEVKPGPYEFEEISTSATDQTMGATGGTGDYLSHCYCQVTTSGATGTCGIEDGSNTAFDNITVVPASSPISTYKIDVNANATTSAGWEITTGAAATAQCYGYFTD